MQVMEVTGGGIDQVVLNGPLSGTTSADAETSTAKSTTQNGETVVGMILSTTGLDTYAAGSGYTLRENLGARSENNTRLAMESRAQATAGSVAATWKSNGWGAAYVAAMITIKPKTAAATLTPSVFVQSHSSDSGVTSSPSVSLAGVSAGNWLVLAVARPTGTRLRRRGLPTARAMCTRCRAASNGQAGAHDGVALFTAPVVTGGSLTRSPPSARRSLRRCR